MVEEFPVTNTIDDSTANETSSNDGSSEPWVSPEIVAARAGEKVQFGKNLQEESPNDEEE